jgi:hypothetical protein
MKAFEHADQVLTSKAAIRLSYVPCLNNACKWYDPCTITVNFGGFVVITVFICESLVFLLRIMEEVFNEKENAWL